MAQNIYAVDHKSDTPCQIPGLEWIYCGVFGLKRDGVFVEIGAHDGRSWSNTAFLADLGWRGVYAEPVHHLAERCRQNHAKNPNVDVVEEAIGNGNPITIRQNGDTDYLFTGNPEFAKLNSATKVTGNFNTLRLDDLLGLKHIQPGFDLLVIDVEGMEVDVLRGFNITKWWPKLVIIETHELNPNAEMAERTEFINDYFLITEYRKIFTSAINTIFMKVI